MGRRERCRGQELGREELDVPRACLASETAPHRACLIDRRRGGACPVWVFCPREPPAPRHFRFPFYRTSAGRSEAASTQHHRRISPAMSVLRAAYASPADATKTIASADLPALPASPSTAQRVAHLAALQSAVKSAQADVNAFLTQQMEHGT